jgi:1-acyl-sn-glycerol-3-phosphate acyltransferase
MVRFHPDPPYMSEGTRENPIKKLENNGKKDFAYKSAQKSLKFAIERFWGDKFKVNGLENVPTGGAAIVAANHPSHIDDMFLIPTINRPMHFVGRQDKDFNPLYVKLTYPMFGVISSSKNVIERGRQFVEQVDRVVKNGELICIYPEKLYVEDRLNKDEVGEFASGIVHLAKKYNLPIIPVYISGTQNVRPDSEVKLTQKMHVNPVEITIGKTIVPGEVQSAEKVRQVIIGLKNKLI